MGAIVISFLWWIALALLAVAFIPLTAVLSLTIPFDRRRRALLWESRLWCLIVARAWPAWRVEPTGLERIERGRPYVIVSNHQSFADILVLSYLPILFRWVSKREIFFVPIFGWQMWVFGHLSLKRRRRKSIERFMRRARSTLESGLSILIFPEGTRSRTGALGSFKPGGFQLASDTGTAILPVVIGGTFDTLPKKTWVIRGRSYARLHVLPPIEVARGDDPAVLSERTREAILSKHQEVQREAADRLARWYEALGESPDPCVSPTRRDRSGSGG